MPKLQGAQVLGRVVGSPVQLRGVSYPGKVLFVPEDRIQEVVEFVGIFLVDLNALEAETSISMERGRRRVA